MEDSEELKVAELLASRLCHDLIGPVSAISNGMELLAEGDLGLDEEAGRLVSESAGQASTVLQFYRLAYGAAGNEVMDFPLMRRLSEELLAFRGIALDWPESLPPILPRGIAKLLLNLVALAGEALPRGGVVTLVVEADGGLCRLRATARGRDANLREEVASQLAEPRLDSLTARSVSAFYSRRVAERLGGSLTLGAGGGDEVALEATMAE